MFRAVPHEGCFCDCCCSNSSALQECVGQSTKLEVRSAGHADTKSCLSSPPSVLFSMTGRGRRERYPPLRRVSGCWKTLVMGPPRPQWAGSCLPPPGLVPAQPHSRSTAMPPCPGEKKTNPSAKHHRSVPAGKAAGDPANAGGRAKGGAPCRDGVSLWGAQPQPVPRELSPGLAPCWAFACI